MNRRMRKKYWSKLKKINRFERIDRWGNILDWNLYGDQWVIHEKEAVHIKTILKQEV